MLFWGAFRTAGRQLRTAGTAVIGFDYPAIERMAAAQGCPSEACVVLFAAAEGAALSAIQERMKDASDG